MDINIPFRNFNATDVAFDDGNKTTNEEENWQDEPVLEEGSSSSSRRQQQQKQEQRRQSQQQKRQKHQLHSFIEMAIPYFHESTKGRWLFVFLIILMILNSAVRVAFSYLARDFWTALADYDEERFYKVILQFLLSLTILAPINVFYRFQRQRLAISWREWMTNRVLSLYYSNRVYYSLERNMNSMSTSTNISSANMTNSGGNPSSIGELDDDHLEDEEDKGDTNEGWIRQRQWQKQRRRRQQQHQQNQRSMMDNPDQRIAEDVKHFTGYSLSLFLTIAVSLIDLVAFSVILYSIQPNLFLSIIAFAVIGTIVTVWIGKALVTLNFLRLRKEADFRYSLVRIRENAESIAFFDSTTTSTATASSATSSTGINSNDNNDNDPTSGAGDKSKHSDSTSHMMMEGQYVATRFRSVISNAKDIIGTQRNLDFFTTFYDYLTWILPIIVVAPDYFNGLVEMGVVQQATAAFSHVLDDLSIIITEFESLSEFSAAIDRLYQFLSAIRQADPDRDEETVPLMSMVENIAANDQKRNEKPPSRQETALAGPETDFRRMDDDNDKNKKPQRDPPSDDGMQRGEASADIGTRRTNIDLQQMPPFKETLSMASSPPSSSSKMTALSLQNVTLMTPDHGRTLIRNLSMQLSWGQRLLIVGPSGVGKSSLLRAIAGLWTAGSGSILRPHKEDIYFLPQKPYCPLGTLRDQLLYPHTTSSCNEDEEKQAEKVEAGFATCDTSLSGVDSENWYKATPAFDDERLLQILDDIGLQDLAYRAGDGNAKRGLDTVLDWSNTLSLGEQQRLAFGRVFLHRPRLVILDESTSAMDVHCETKMYSLMSGFSTSAGDADEGGTTYISVGHRPTLLSHHDLRLEIKTVESHSVESISSARERASTEEVHRIFSYS